MKRKYFIIFCIFFATFCIFYIVFWLSVNKMKKDYEDTLKREMYITASDYFPLVDDEETAIKIAEVVYEKVYNKKISKEYTRAGLNGAIWEVYCYDIDYKSSDESESLFEWDMRVNISKNTGIVEIINTR